MHLGGVPLLGGLGLVGLIPVPACGPASAPCAHRLLLLLLCGVVWWWGGVVGHGGGKGRVIIVVFGGTGRRVRGFG